MRIAQHCVGGRLRGHPCPSIWRRRAEGLARAVGRGVSELRIQSEQRFGDTIGPTEAILQRMVKTKNNLEFLENLTED